MHKRVTITIDEEVLRLAEARVAAGDARSLSALISGFTEQGVRREKTADIAREILAETGPLTEEEHAWVDEVVETSRLMQESRSMRGPSLPSSGARSSSEV